MRFIDPPVFLLFGADIFPPQSRNFSSAVAKEITVLLVDTYLDV